MQPISIPPRATVAYKFSLVVVRNKNGEFLAVNESRHRGWWLPGGRVERGENFAQAAFRETLEEAGIHIRLLGVIRF